MTETAFPANIGRPATARQLEATRTPARRPGLRRLGLLAAIAGLAAAAVLPGTAAAFGVLEPVAIITATPVSGTAPLLVTFDGSASTGANGPVTGWAWDFGDGTTGSGAVTSHTYTAAGTFAASLVVSDGLISLPRTVTITVDAVFHPIEPVASIAATPTSGTAPLTVAFDGSGSVASSPIAAYDWTFGDGTTGSGAIVTHVYTAAGTYTASLVVTTSLGLASIPRTTQIVVAPRVAPGAPTGLTATAKSKSSIALAWVNATTDQTSVRVERCKGTGCTRFSLVKTLTGSTTSFTDTRLSSNTVYVYRVRAANAVGASPWSNLASARTLR